MRIKIINAEAPGRTEVEVSANDKDKDVFEYVIESLEENTYAKIC